MEELVVELFHRSAERELARMTESRASVRPLRAIWYICIHTHDARITSEFMALANHDDELKGKVVRYVKQSCKLQFAALTEAIAHTGSGGVIAPIGLAILATSVGLSLNCARQLGVD